MASYDFERGELDFLDIISLMSFYIGLKNLELNEQQVEGLMKEMTDNQDKLLIKSIQQNETIIRQNSEIIQLLKEIKNERNNGI